MTDIQYYIKKENDLKSLNFDAQDRVNMYIFFHGILLYKVFSQACLNFVYATPTCIIAEVGTSIIAEVDTSIIAEVGTSIIAEVV